MKQNVPDPIPLTQEAYDKFKANFDRLTKEREEVKVRLQIAREMGDLSENGAYKYAKFELGSIGRQLRDIRHVLRYGKVVQPKHDGSADFGSSITLERQGKEFKFMLVSKHESNPAEKKLSTDSPYGKAVMGKHVGDQVIVHAPAGELTFTIKAIE